MKVLVFPHHLEIGGSQTNAIELAAAARDLHSHDVVVFATPGPARGLIEQRRLRYVEAPAPRVHPSIAMLRALQRVVRDERPDVVHAWEWPQCVDAYYAVKLPDLAPVVGSDMDMTVNRRLPPSLPVTYGTAELAEQASRLRAAPVLLLEPPVDTHLNRPGAVDGAAFRHQHGLDGQITLVIVSRLIAWLKLEGIRRTMEAVARLRRELPVRLVVVGGGSAEARVAQHAEVLNRLFGERVVVLTGPLVDPRPAYAAADVVLGMGGSILRGMAFAKPCIVLGEGGFSEPFTPETSARFLWQGFYGQGRRETGPDPLAAQLEQLLADTAALRRLGEYSRQLVLERFSLRAASGTVEQLYKIAQTGRPQSPLAIADEATRTSYRVASSAVVGKLRRLRQRA